MRAAVSSTKRAKGIVIAHKRGHTGVTVIIPDEMFDKLKASAIKNCRTLTSECRYWIVKGLTEAKTE
jgi:hypothetical protein